MFTRRFILQAAAVAPLAACAGQSAAQIAAQAAQDIGLIGTGLAGALPGLQATGAVSASVVSTITGYVNQISTVAASITASSTQAAGQSAFQQIETLVNAIVSAAAGLSLPAPFGTALSAASVLLPVIETAVGLAVNAVKSAPPVAAMAVPMKADDARLILAAAAKH